MNPEAQVTGGRQRAEHREGDLETANAMAGSGQPNRPDTIALTTL
jgi:hypothetical protein